ncbi:hypothetical protein [Flavobacterium crassostreae]|uniref:Peptidase M56 domain-containing protein n=1 Tax=Flavobacterium crassostreae TaxID=1763534 RepID=A0A1B9E815_9FLAO|nr:hypothetical protein [Flavobacterium crassostreae]OCB78090.1 hypothetical protein LPBF_03860 [Flavobacterium crassostreae]
MFLVFVKWMVPKGFRGWTMYPFVFVKCKLDKGDAVFVNHEKIHLRQQTDLLIIPFFVWYLFEFLFRLLQYKNAELAYLNLSFEREAYRNETDLNYLKNRKFLEFLKYL